MNSVDTVLNMREVSGRQIRVGMIGAGATGRAIALQLGTPAPGIRLVAICNRSLENGERAFREAGVTDWARVDSALEADQQICSGRPVLTNNPAVLAGCESIDILLEVTGTVEAAAAVVVNALRHRKHVVIVNAELDSLVGPILKAKADEAGVVLTNTDGDEPGVAMTLVRYLRTLGLKVVAAGNIKGMVDYYRTPATQKAFAEKYDQDARKVTSFADSTKLSMEATVLANATGFRVGRRGMHGPACGYVREVGNLLPADQMLSTGLVDYALGAAPHTGAFAVIHEENALKKAQLGYYKLGDGPFYVFYTPYHLPHLQIASTIGRAVVHQDATVAPLDGPVCEVVSVAKCDLKAGERLDGVGGFCTYGLIDNRQTARDMNALPIGLSEGCVLRSDVQKDTVISFDDVEQVPGGVAWDLWQEQNARWPVIGAPTLAQEREFSVSVR
ncbi:NAD(P)-dependent oxidoreductase [Alloacidobacterium dinghuense]|uniref:NAD(P)-dependent oxidoreductase n=1 Tax=Alloacidobacterium dinghuense TaxID=2763107 RepID=A0A7G8BLT8_9BACT|nr:NAD(P)-dependent oxidoreductase [Alloacidobacterium dinghuense]QNI33508.1 NAD(P)-dependent oxidoreductase [Alloacidobacterium dinghuense]